MNYGADWRLRIEPTIGHRRVSTVTRRVVLEMIGALKEGNVSAGQINKALKTVSSMFAYAVDARIVADNPVLGVRRLPEAKNLERATYPLADIELVASTARSMRENGWSTMDMDDAAWLGARDYALIRLAVLTGLCWGEFAALEWPDVRKDHLLVRRALGDPDRRGGGGSRDLLARAQSRLGCRSVARCRRRRGSHDDDVPYRQGLGVSTGLHDWP